MSSTKPAAERGIRHKATPARPSREAVKLNELRDDLRGSQAAVNEINAELARTKALLVESSKREAEQGRLNSALRTDCKHFAGEAEQLRDQLYRQDIVMAEMRGYLMRIDDEARTPERGEARLWPRTFGMYLQPMASQATDADARTA